MGLVCIEAMKKHLLVFFSCVIVSAWSDRELHIASLNGGSGLLLETRTLPLALAWPPYS